MRELLLHIEYLLKRTDCVILPGVGAMISVRRPAYFDCERGILFPPSRRISFNSCLKEDDGLLAHSVARRDGISFEEGRRRVSDMIEGFREQLKEFGEIEAPGFGRFTLEEENTILFHPRFKERNDSIALGMPEIMLSGSTASPEDVFTGSEVCGRTFRRVGDRYSFSFSRHALHIAASVAFLFVMAVTLLFLSPELGVRRGEDKASVLPVEKISLVKTVENRQKDTPAPAADRAADEPLNYLIVGTFTSEKEAADFIAYNDDLESNLEIVKGNGRTWRVSLASSSDRSELQKVLNSKEFKDKWESGWIWKQSL